MLWLGLFCTSLVCADDLPALPRAELWTTTGERISGTLLSLADQQLNLQVAEQVRPIPFDSVWQIAFMPLTSRPLRPRFWLHLTNGDRVGVTSVALNEEEVEFQIPAVEDSRKLGVEFITGIQPLRPGTSWRTDESDWAQVNGLSEKTDLVALRNGDLQTGELSELSSQSLQLSETLGRQDLAWDAVTALRMNPQLAEIPLWPKTGWLVLLADESWLTATAIEVEGDHRLKLMTIHNIEVRLPLEMIRGITHWGAGAAPLSRILPATQTHVPLLGPLLEITRDRNVRGLPMRSPPTFGTESDSAGGMPVLCPQGWGLTSGMTVRWNLNGKYLRFQCGFGLDATACADGDATVAIRVDDRPQKEISLRAGKPVHRETSIDLTGAQTLTIETGYGQQADVCDWIDLYVPILVPAP